MTHPDKTVAENPQIIDSEEKGNDERIRQLIAKSASLHVQQKVELPRTSPRQPTR